MNESIDAETSAIERMLHDRTRHACPSALRARVLAAVDEVLLKKTKVPAITYGTAAQPHSPEYADVVAVTCLIVMVTALSVPLVATLAWTAPSRHGGLAADRPMLSLAQRAEVAGITLDMACPSTEQLAGRDVPFDNGGRPHDILRSIDARSFLQGEL